MVLRERSAALAGAANGSAPLAEQPVEQSLVDLLSQGLPPRHPDTDLVAMIMSEVRLCHSARSAMIRHDKKEMQRASTLLAVGLQVLFSGAMGITRPAAVAVRLAP